MKYIEIKERHTGKVLYADLIGADLRNTRLQNANIENSFLFNVGIDFIKQALKGAKEIREKILRLN